MVFFQVFLILSTWKKRKNDIDDILPYHPHNAPNNSTYHSSFNTNHNLSEELSVAEIKSMMEEKKSAWSSIYTQIDI